MGEKGNRAGHSVFTHKASDCDLSMGPMRFFNTNKLQYIFKKMLEKAKIGMDKSGGDSAGNSVFTYKALIKGSVSRDF